MFRLTNLQETSRAMRLFHFSSALASIDEEDGKENDEVFESKASASVLQFTKSISALNAVSLGVQVLKAKVRKEEVKLKWLSFDFSECLPEGYPCPSPDGGGLQERRRIVVERLCREFHHREPNCR